MTESPSGRLKKAIPLLVKLAFVSGLLCGSSPASEPMWGSTNLLSGPKLKSGDIVEVVLCERDARRDTRRDAEADDSDGDDRAQPIDAPLHSPRNILRSLSARIVKVLPNGNLVLEARIKLGPGTLLLGGEAARIDVSVERTVALSRLSNLAIVARSVNPELLSGILKSAGALRLADGQGKTAKKLGR